MEFTKITINRAEFTVIFDGSKYILHSSLFGLVAVAERVTPCKTFECFNLRVGHKNLLGYFFTDSVIASAMKRYIKRHENVHVKKADIHFNEIYEDLSQSGIRIEVIHL